MPTEQYVVIVHDPSDPWNASVISDLKECVPEARVLSELKNRYLIECPIHCETDLLDYFSGEHCTISKNRKYKLNGGANHV